MIKRRGKLGLLKVNTDWEGVKTWLAEKRGKETTVQYTLNIKKGIYYMSLCWMLNKFLFVCLFCKGWKSFWSFEEVYH